MKAFKLEARAINAVTKMTAEKEGVNIWRQVQVQVSVLLVSPEMLSTPGFENLLLNSWGAGFRPMFLQIGYM
ncbi:hypothetical protein K443DRAFT_673777 [Laccaria amethystina LaAM-08-1]|uniref:Uncharacterized protein n=1 Tax=Laccaria amethystina LaAM-08-1 TaxID=1095629 RepID=A0A0C9X409_9AGAR|nr:hypothetical protein K443DRAFT_673777 [Laccaria amethystina LaAM-08-1]